MTTAATPSLFPLESVRLREGLFAAAQRTDLEYLLGLEAERLLAPFRREAGIATTAAPYGNWESMGLDGHIGGHALAAASLMWAATGDERAAELARQLVEGLRECQARLGTGYVGGIPGGAELWAQIRTIASQAQTWDLGGAWVPWYNLHKTFAGLIEAVRHAPAGTASCALEVLRGLGDWGARLGEQLDDEAFARMLRTEFGGMCAAYADLAEITGEERHARMARRFADESLLAPLRAGRDELDGMHANTQIAKVIGWPALGETAAAETFVRTVLERRTLAFGGNSVAEHFTAEPLAHVTDREGPESCNTVNMLEAEQRLYEHGGGPWLFDAIERQLVGHVLSAQHPEGGFVYFTPARPGHYRVYSTRENDMWCCVGTGLEVYARTGRFTFAAQGGDLLVNLPLPASLRWEEQGIAAHLDSPYPRPAPETPVTLRIEADAPRDVAVHVRVPAWATTPPTVSVDGQDVTAHAELDGYVTVRRRWQGGEVLRWTLHAGPSWEPLPGADSWGSLRWGPVVLAARDGEEDLAGLWADDSRMGHVAHGPLRRLSSTPVLLGTPAQIASRLRPLADGGFELHRPDGPPLTLEPFYDVHESRYTLCFPHAPDPAAAQLRREELARIDAAQLDRAARAVDAVACGQQQPETEHAYRGTAARSGVTDGRQWRATHEEFSYLLADPAQRATTLRVTYLAAPGRAQVLVDGDEVGTLDGGGAEHEIRDVEFPVPRGTHRVAVRALDDGGETPPVLELLLLGEG